MFNLGRVECSLSAGSPDCFCREALVRPVMKDPTTVTQFNRDLDPVYQIRCSRADYDIQRLHLGT